MAAAAGASLHTKITENFTSRPATLTVDSISNGMTSLSVNGTSSVAPGTATSSAVPGPGTSSMSSNGAGLVGTTPDEHQQDRLCWDEYFMALAFLCAQRSKDPVTQVGACIVNGRNQILSTGYNGMPSGCPDTQMPWGKRSADPLERKRMYVCHAELNAILNKNSADVRGGRVYVTLFPCNECAKLIVQSGIASVVYHSDKHAHKESTRASKAMLTSAGVGCRPYSGNLHQLTLDFSQIHEKLDLCTSFVARVDASNGILDDGSTALINGDRRPNSNSYDGMGLFPVSSLPPAISCAFPTSPASTCGEASELPRPSSAYLTWDEYFMSVAFLSARRCWNSLEQAGACLVNSDRRIVGIGYNGMPRGCPDSLPQKQRLDKSFFECHAEINAVLNKNCSDVRQCSLYVTHFPCNECAKLIVQSGITKIIYFSEPAPNGDSSEAARRLFDMTNTTYLEYTSLGSLKKKVTLDFQSVDA